MTRASSVLLALVLGAGLTACTDDGPEQDVARSSALPSAEASSAPEESASPSAAPAAGDPSSAASSFPADTAVDEQAPTGGPLGLRAARVARQAGFDRVVFELAGKEAGEPGWRVEYVDAPTQDGSGDPVEVGGEFTLAVTLTGTGYPFDTGVEEPSDDPAVPGDVVLVEDVVLGSVFEGQYQAFIGTSAHAPFRVFRLTDPARVVVDLRR